MDSRLFEIQNFLQLLSKDFTRRDIIWHICLSLVTDEKGILIKLRTFAFVTINENEQKVRITMMMTKLP